MERLGFISKEKISPRIYNNTILEMMTKLHPALPFVVYVPVSLFFIIKSVVDNPSVAIHYLWIVPVVIVFWTLLEFLLHLTILHNEKAGVVAAIHTTHHQYPNDPLRLSVPLWASVLGGIVFYFGFRLILGNELINPFFGVLVGYYVIYEFTHLAVHRYNWKNKLFQTIKKHHLKHHFHDNSKGFGFTTTLWDKIFGMDFKQTDEKNEI